MMTTATSDIEYLLALAEEEHQRREALHQTRLRMARMERHAEICAWLRAEIQNDARCRFAKWRLGIREAT